MSTTIERPQEQAAAREAHTLTLDPKPVIVRDYRGAYRCLMCGLGHVALRAAREHYAREHHGHTPPNQISLYPSA